MTIGMNLHVTGRVSPHIISVDWDYQRLLRWLTLPGGALISSHGDPNPVRLMERCISKGRAIVSRLSELPATLNQS
jgi:hypothetical protein